MTANSNAAYALTLAASAAVVAAPNIICAVLARKK